MWLKFQAQLSDHTSKLLRLISFDLAVGGFAIIVAMLHSHITNQALADLSAHRANQASDCGFFYLGFFGFIHLLLKSLTATALALISYFQVTFDI